LSSRPSSALLRSRESSAFRTGRSCISESHQTMMLFQDFRFSPTVIPACVSLETRLKTWRFCEGLCVYLHQVFRFFWLWYLDSGIPSNTSAIQHPTNPNSRKTTISERVGKRAESNEQHVLSKNNNRKNRERKNPEPYTSTGCVHQPTHTHKIALCKADALISISELRDGNRFLEGLGQV